MEKEVINKNTLTAIIITRNEEEMIADCIDSVSFCNEIIVIDSSSVDKTVEIAKRMGAKVYEYNEVLFSQAARRNFGHKKATGDWILYIDADERVSVDLAKEINLVIKSTSNSAYKLPRQDFYFSTTKWPRIEYMERLFKYDALVEWYGDLHETPKVTGQIGILTNYLLHFTHRNLEQMLTKTIEWSTIEANLRLQANHPKITWWRFPRVIISAFFESYIIQKGYKAGTAGIIESLYQSFSMFITYAKLWEMQIKKNR